VGVKPETLEAEEDLGLSRPITALAARPIGRCRITPEAVTPTPWPFRTKPGDLPDAASMAALRTMQKSVPPPMWAPRRLMFRETGTQGSTSPLCWSSSDRLSLTAC
jgi:hypothetical protein